MMGTKTAKSWLIFLMGFLGVGACSGGGMLVISPDGELLGMPVSVLEYSPFPDFLIPGILLLVILGIVPLLLIFALIKKPASPWAEHFSFFGDMHWAWTYCIYVAFALIIWIQVQMALLRTVHWLHTFYMFYAILLIFVCLLPSNRNWYKS
ncbi:hypothetical protein DYBT9275_06071 [Dyadobacter sp. CECT 9275]|uniref:Uncharacterized protein n=1 Tax=Dyadobacter helix TaxID=2822344 RepID=A0A916JI71_9BACT|nr:hypothetical protein [Dyadobacter sp. CECT 9275]CAG5018786.1 hypothetical protein DYBT9275_06071 [Dyadobacter sp. CECT 9275]